MTYEQIVNALENIISEKIGDCKKDCAFYDGKVHSCAQTIALHALDFIKREQAEIEDLKSDKEAIINGQLTIQKMYIEARAEAIREFAERLKEKASSCVMSQNGQEIPETKSYTISILCIDELVKEMTEKEGGNV